MNTFPLPGIPGSNPLGAMAAFGLFRIMTKERPFGEIRLAWKFDGDWRPILHSDHSIDLDQLIQFLIDRQPLRTQADYLAWPDIKCAPREFREKYERVRFEWEQLGHLPTPSLVEAAEFLVAFGSEMVTAKSTPDVKPTAFHMTAGQQKFLKSINELATSLDPTHRTARKQTGEDRNQELREAFRNALHGPWRYADSNHALGWDPTTEGLYALSDISPSIAGPRSVRAAIWLAFEALPLFPAVPCRQKLCTTGFDLRDDTFTWPIWEPSISIDTLRVWLGSTALEEPDMATLRLRGIRAVLRSKCVRDANGRGTFRNAIGIH